MSGRQELRISAHARIRMEQRGATEAEVHQTAAEGPWEPAQRGKKSVRMTFPFDAISPVDGKRYASKTVECILAEEPDYAIVVTVKVYFGDRQGGAQ